MPMMGFGTARLKGDRLRGALRFAVAECGLRHVDCAKVYGNEHIVGEVLAGVFESGAVARKDLFITSKLWNDDHRPEHVAQACRRTLADLRLDYLDLYLVHWPTAWRKGTVLRTDAGVTLGETWRAMELLVEEGLVKNIGVSNFDIQRLEELHRPGLKRPVAVNQVELHPDLAQGPLVEHCKAKGIVVTAWSPLLKSPGACAEREGVKRCMDRHSADAASVVLAWHLARGVCAIPRSGSPAHIRANIEGALQLRLGEKDLEDIATADKGRRMFPDLVGAFSDTATIWRVLSGILHAIAYCFWAIIPNRLDLRMPCGK